MAPSYRKEKVDRYVFEKDKYLSLGVTYLLRKALLDLGIDYSKIEIEYTKKNKPFLKSIEGVYFNLSHSEKMVMCAISDKEIGCDIQYESDKSDESDEFIDIANRFFSEKEIELINNMDNNEDKKDMFYRIWTLKESYIKLLGIGIDKSFSKTQIYFDNDQIKVKTDNDIDTSVYFEEITLLDLDSLYKCSICSKSNDKCEIIIESEYK